MTRYVIIMNRGTSNLLKGGPLADAREASVDVDDGTSYSTVAPMDSKGD